MFINIKQYSEQPIYDQIKNQIKQQILNGTIKEGELLPSIRALAKELNVSVITTKRAYEELEREGYIVTIPAKGTYVKKIDKDKLVNNNIAEVEDQLKKVIEYAKLFDINREILIEIIKKLY